MITLIKTCVSVTILSIGIGEIASLANAEWAPILLGLGFLTGAIELILFLLALVWF